MGPSVAVLSQRTLHQVPWFSQLVEFEDVLTEMLDADRFDFVAQSNPAARAVARRGRIRSVASTVPFLRPYTLGTPDTVYDVGIVVVNNLADLGRLEGVHQWRSIATTMVAVVGEVWPVWFGGARRIVESVVSQFDHLFVTVRGLESEMHRLSGTPVTFLPPGVDTLRSPTFAAADRRIDVLNLGRRSAAQHRAFVDWCATQDRFYEFDTGSMSAVNSHDEHRRQIVERIARSQVFVANYARFDQPDVCQGAVELGLRYFEALAGGCIIVGEHPDPAWCREVLGELPGLIEMSSRSTTVPGELVELLADPLACDEAHRAHRWIALEHHDVLHRWNSIADIVGIATAPGVGARRRALEQAAAALVVA